MSTLEMAKVTSKGQITIPVSIRRKLNINEGDKILFIDSPGGVVMVNPDMLPVGRGAEEPEMPAESQGFPGALPSGASKQGDGAASAAPPEDDAAAPAELRKKTAAADTSDAAKPAAAVTPPVKEVEKPAPKVHGFDLNTLLDEIRTIGSKI